MKRTIPALFLFSLLLMIFVYPRPSSAQTMEIWFLGGYGNAGVSTLIKGPNDTVVLFDEGGGADFAPYIKAVMDAEGITFIDYAILSHYHGDHYGALNDLGGLLDGHDSFGTYYDRGGTTTQTGGGIAAEYYDYVTAVGGKRQTVQLDGSSDIDLGKGAALRFLSCGVADTTNTLNIRGGGTVTVSEENNLSISCLVTYPVSYDGGAGFDLYLGGDLQGTGERAIDDVVVTTFNRMVDVNLIDHHGASSATTSSREFLGNMDPELVVIPCWDSGHGHPTEATVWNIQSYVEPYDQRIIRLHPGDSDDGGWAPEDMDYCVTISAQTAGEQLKITVADGGCAYTVTGNNIDDPDLVDHWTDDGLGCDPTATPTPWIPSPTPTPTPSPSPSPSPSTTPTPTFPPTPTPYSSDILENFSFEESPDLVYWKKEGTEGKINKTDITQYDGGSYSCVFEDLGKQYTARGIYSNYINVTAMNNYYFSGWFYAAFEASTGVDNTRFRFNVHWYSSNFSEVDSETSSFTLSAYDTWENQSYASYNAPPGSALTRVRVNVKEYNTTDCDAYIDYFQFGVAPETPTPTPSPIPTATPSPSPSPIPDYDLWATLTDATGPVYSVYADSYYVYALSNDDNVYVWRYGTWALETKIPEVPGGWGGVYADGAYIYTVDTNEELKRWNRDDFVFDASKSCGAGALKNVYGDGSDYVFVASSEGSTFRYNRSNFNQKSTLSNPGACRYDVYVDSYYIYAADGDKKIYTWDTSLNFQSDFSPHAASNWSTESAAMLAVHADSYYIYAGCDNNNLYVFDRDTFDYVTRKDFATGDINAVWANRDEYYGASDDSNIYVYTKGEWNLTASLEDGTDKMWDVYADTEYIFGACEDNKVYIWLALHAPSPTPTPTPETAPTATPSPTPDYYNEVIINEIAWMGTVYGSDYEWIELYNTTGSDISIENWSIHGADTGAKLNFSDADGFETYTVPADGYLLYAGDQSVFFSGATEQIWDSAIVMNNTSPGQIILYDAPNGGGNTIDVANQVSGDWFAGDGTGRITMEKIDPSKAGTLADNWGDWNGTTFATDGDGNDIYGSPGRENSIYSSGPTSTPTPSPTPTPDGYKTPTPTPSPVPTSPPVDYNKIVFNEIAWMGTKVNRYHEWIELYVNEDDNWNLQSWKIVADDGYPNFYIDTDVITVDAGDYVLLVYYYADAVTTPQYDYRYEWGNALTNTGEILHLKNPSGEIIDTLNMDGYWWAGKNDPTNGYYYTMERVRPDWPSNKQFTWADWNTLTYWGEDAVGDPLQGTAKYRNSVYSESAPTPAVTPTPAPYGDVVFNEIAWGGTKADSQHEWIELRNNTQTDIDLYYFRILSKSENVDFTIETHIIIPGESNPDGYYFALLKHDTEYTVRDLKSDDYNWVYVYPYGNLMSNDGEYLTLYDSEGIIWDDIDWNPTNNWPAGSAYPDYYTMEKINPYATGNASWNWADNDGVTVAGRDANDQLLFGTAGAENSGAVPTAVTLKEFFARGYDSLVAVIWETGVERENLGFHLYRATSSTGPYERITDELILGLGNSPAGDRYLFIDHQVENGKVYYYKLEDISWSGESKFHGPVEAIPREQAGEFIFDPSDYRTVVENGPSPFPTPTPEGRPPVVPTSTCSPSPTPTVHPATTPSPTPWPSPLPFSLLPIIASGDYDGDGTSDIAIFRAESGLWCIRAWTRFYFGSAGDIPVSGDYDGDLTAEIAIFRPYSGLWAMRFLSRCYFGSTGDIPVPADYDGDGLSEIAIFRPATGLWAIRRVTRQYFGTGGDWPVPADYRGDGTREIAIFRPSTGLWVIQGLTRLYFGSKLDWPAPRDYDGDGKADIAIFRPSSAFWAIGGRESFYFGREGDLPVPLKYQGGPRSQIAIFRPISGLWVIKDTTRLYFGTSADIPVTR